LLLILSKKKKLTMLTLIIRQFPKEMVFILLDWSNSIIYRTLRVIKANQEYMLTKILGLFHLWLA